MNLNALAEMAILIVFIVFIALILLQIKKLWKVKSNLGTFLAELKLLNSNFNNIIDMADVEFDKIMKTDEQKICQYCKNKIAYLDISKENIFYYKCKLNSKDINLDYSCKSFQKDLQNSKI